MRDYNHNAWIRETKTTLAFAQAKGNLIRHDQLMKLKLYSMCDRMIIVGVQDERPTVNSDIRDAL